MLAIGLFGLATDYIDNGSITRVSAWLIFGLIGFVSALYFSDQPFLSIPKESSNTVVLIGVTMLVGVIAKFMGLGGLAAGLLTLVVFILFFAIRIVGEKITDKARRK